MKHKKKSKDIAPYLFCLPFIIAFFVIYLYPFCKTIMMSFQDVRPTGENVFIGLRNFRNLFTDHFTTALKNTLVYTVLNTSVQFVLGMAFALILNRRLPMRNILRCTIFVPVLTSTIIAGIIFRLLFGSLETSLANQIAMGLGVIKEPIAWLTQGQMTGNIMMVIVACWRSTGVTMIYFLSALQGVPEELKDAARIDGANNTQVFRHITIPSIRPTLIYVLTMSILGGFSVFTESYALWNTATPGDIGLTMTRYLYQMGFNKVNFGMASAIGIILMIIICSINLIQLKCLGLFREED